MHLTPEHFDLVANGSKALECRLYDEKRRTIELGDTIVFARADDPEQTVETEVIGLLLYRSFDELLSGFDPSVYGGKDQASFLEGLRSFYPEEQERECGVVGIRVRTVEG